MRTSVFSLATVAFLASVATAAAQTKEVVIGIIYPLSGPVAQVGKDAIAAVETAVQIVNESHDLDMPLAKDAGLSGLDGAKIRLVIGDHQGKPDIGQGETERMINQESVSAMYGAYHSSVTAAASQVTERAGIPWVNGASTSPQLTTRGFKYFFRVTPHDGEFSELMFEFADNFQKKQDQKFESVAIIHEDTLWGADSGRVQNQLAKDKGYNVLENISYRAKTTSLSSEVQRLKSADADMLLPSSYTSDAVLFLRTAKELDYNPKLLVAQNAGYTDPSFLETMGKDAEGVITRSPFNTDLAERIPLIGKVNELFKAHTGGRDLSDVPARAFTGFIALADAINRAGSTDPEKIRQALTETDIPASQLIVPYRGVKFGPDGQNELTRAILMQVQNGKYCTVYPFELAACELKYPMPTWAEKAKM